MRFTSVPIAQAKNRLPHWVHEVEAGRPVQLTRHGRPAAVLISVETFAAMHEPRAGFTVDLQRFRRQHHAHLLTSAESTRIDSARPTDAGREVDL